MMISAPSYTCISYLQFVLAFRSCLSIKIVSAAAAAATDDDDDDDDDEEEEEEEEEEEGKWVLYNYIHLRVQHITSALAHISDERKNHGQCV